MPLGLAILFIVSALVLIALQAYMIVRLTMRPPRRTEGVAIAQGWPIDPEALGVAYEDWSIDDDLDTWLITGGDPTGPTVILSHGWADSRIGSLGWVPVIQPRVANLILYDLRGHGDNPHPYSTLGRDEPDDLQRIIDAVNQRLDTPPVVLLGVSLGVGIAVQAALNNPDIRGVIADSSFLIQPNASGRIVARMGLPRWPATPLAWLYMRWRLGRSIPVPMQSLAPQLACPLLVLHGTDDIIVPPAHARRLADLAPQSTLHLFPDCGHVHPALDEPDTYQQHLADWFDAIKT